MRYGVSGNGSERYEAGTYAYMYVIRHGICLYAAYSIRIYMRYARRQQGSIQRWYVVRRRQAGVRKVLRAKAGRQVCWRICSSMAHARVKGGMLYIYVRYMQRHKAEVGTGKSIVW